MKENSVLIKTAIPGFSLRLAEPIREDAEIIVEFLRLLGIHQQTEASMTKDPQAIIDLLAGEKCEIVFGIYENSVVGMNIASEMTAACSGITGLYIEGFFIEDAYRGMGFGKSFMAFFAKQALTRGHKRLQWFLMDNNVVGRGFYAAINGTEVPGMGTWRMGEEELVALSKKLP